MRFITARNSDKKCNGFKGCGDIIFTSFRYSKLRGKKRLCEKCLQKKENAEDELFWRLLLNKVG